VSTEKGESVVREREEEEIEVTEWKGGKFEGTFSL
jgi:hypothetical protein